MSTKTLRKRIALVAVATLGAGVLSVAPANATAPTSIVFSDDYQTSATLVNGKNQGVCFSAEANSTTYTANQLATTTQNAANKVEMVSTGRLNFSGAAADMTGASDELRFVITGPAVWAGFTASANPATPTLSGNMKSYTFSYAAGGSTQAAPADLQLAPTGVGTIQVTISHYDHSSLAHSSAGVSVAKIVTISSVATCGAGAYSAGDSSVKLVAVGDKDTAATNSNDASGASTAANGESVYIRYDLRDSNGTDLADGTTTGTVTAEVTGGLVVGASDTGTISSAFTTGKTDYFKINQGTADTPQTGTVTIKLNGVTVATRTVNITGPAASIAVSGLDVRPLGSNSPTQTGDYVVRDSAGNALAVAITGFVTLTDAQSRILTAGASTRTPDPSSLTTPTGQFSTTCSGTRGGTATGLQLRIVTSALVTITSPAFSLTCGGTVFSYTASLDKATYVPGDIATLTISAKDAFGNVVHDAETIGTAGAGTEASIAGSNLTAVVAPTNADTFTNGVRTYRYVVGSTEGSYNMIVDLDEHTSSATGQSAVTIPYKIAASSAAVSNADVLKAIVSLIASINKQIATLQRALLRR